jgi:hypothetical protein
MHLPVVVWLMDWIGNSVQSWLCEASRDGSLCIVLCRVIIRNAHAVQHARSCTVPHLAVGAASSYLYDIGIPWDQGCCRMILEGGVCKGGMLEACLRALPSDGNVFLIRWNAVLL